jgi:hypothetical protein
MTAIVNTSVRTVFNDPLAGLAPVDKVAVNSKQTLSAETLGAKADAQVLDVVAAAKTKFEKATPTDQAQYLSTANFTEADSEVMMNVFLAAVAQQQKADPKDTKGDPISALIAFDPSAWEKHASVFLAAIFALNAAKKASAEMSGKFAIMAFESAKAQGVAIIKGGEAAMFSAISGAVVAGAMSVGGAALQLKGNAQKHTDIKTNQRDAVKFDALAASKRQDLKAFDQAKMASGPKTTTGINNKGDTLTLKAQKDADRLTDSERANLETGWKETLTSARDARMESKLAQKTYDGNITKGNAISSMAMILSSGLSSIIRLEEVANREKEVLRGAEQGVNKSVSDAATQNVAEDNSMLLKFLEGFQQILEGRNATLSTIASARA